MVRRFVVLGLVFALISTLALIAAIQSPPPDVEAQSSPPVIDRLCLDRFNGYYKVLATPNCPPYHTAIAIPDDYPVTLCASAFDLYLRAPLYSGECRPYTAVRIDLPADEAPNICLVWATGRLRLAVPYPDGNCAGGSYAINFPDTERRYETFGNVDIDVPAEAGLLPGQPAGVTVTAFDATSAEGGTVDVDPDGAFRYTPPAGFIGEDTFNYTLDDGVGTTNRTAVIDVLSPTVWFVDADAVDPGDGRRLTPFNDLQVLNDDGNDPDEPGDFIFLYETGTPYGDGLLLEEDQALVGQEVDLGVILSMEIADAPALQGSAVAPLPPHIVLPDVDPTPNTPILTNDDAPALIMAESSTVAGLTMESEIEVTVYAEEAGDLLLYVVNVYGASRENDEGGGAAVELYAAQMTISSSEIIGGNGGDGEFDGADGGPGVVIPAPFEGDPTRSSLQGETIPEVEQQLIVTDSTIAGGNGGNGFEDGGYGGAGIEAMFAVMSITDSTISGGNGGDGGEDPDSWGGDGGAGIMNGIIGPLGFESSERSLLGDMPFSVDYLAVEGSTIIGGAGGAGSDEGGYGGNGIDTGLRGPIFASSEGERSLQGVTEVTLTATVTESTVVGGPGGAALEELSDGIGGDGGQGIWGVFFPYFGTSDRTELQGSPPPMPAFTFNLVVSDTALNGGVGGSGLNSGGYGGAGLLTSGFEATVDQGSVVTGGAGGVSPEGEAGLGAPGIFSGFFAIFLSNVEEPRYAALADGLLEESRELQGPGFPPFDFPTGSLTVDSSTVSGGTTPGSFFVEFDIFSGDGIVAFGNPFIETESSLQGGFGGEFDPIPVTITNSVVNGADGSDAVDGEAVPGGFGVIAVGANLTIDGSSQINGGDGGDGEVGGYGGEGIAVDTSETYILNSTVTGGDAGNTSGAGAGSDGGAGITASNCQTCDTLEVSGSVVSGGSGGGATSNVGGSGGPGIAADNESVVITTSTITAGAPGNGTSAEGTAAVHLYLADVGDITAEITDNTLIGSPGGLGQAPSLHVEVDSGTICVHATGNTPTGAFELENVAGTLGITQPDTATLSSDNDDVDVIENGTITYDCSLTPEP